MTKKISAMFSSGPGWQRITPMQATKFGESSLSGAVSDYCQGTDVGEFTHARCLHRGDPWVCAQWELGTLDDVMRSEQSEAGAKVLS